MHLTAVHEKTGETEPARLTRERYGKKENGIDRSIVPDGTKDIKAALGR